MPAYIRKTKAEILSNALTKIQKNTPITAVSPGSVMRAFTEAITSELGDMYDIMDFNVNQNLVSTASGSALDMLGSLYGTSRKSLNNLAAIDKQLGSFYFYLSNVFASDITIPKGTNIFTDITSFTGQHFSYATTDAVIIPAGRTKAFASIAPNFADSVGTAGPGTLVTNDFTSPAGVTVLCTNPKTISAQVGYEDDDTYRVRIIKSIRVKSAGTLDAVRFAGLNITGIRDIKVRQAPYGMGSFEVLIIPDQNGDTLQAIATASAAMDLVRPMGVRMYVKQPTNISFEISVNLIIPSANISQIVDTTTQRAKTGIYRYLNNLLPGAPVVYNTLISTILDSSDLIQDVIITRYAVSGTEIMRRNYTPADNEQIVPGNITVQVATS